MAGDDDFHEQALCTSKRFKSREREYDKVSFSGVNIDKSQDGYQRDYIDKLQTLKQGAEFDAYRSLPAKLMWLVNTRPEISCATSMASRVTFDLFKEDS
jgi:hypothetical protein